MKIALIFVYQDQSVRIKVYDSEEKAVEMLNHIGKICKNHAILAPDYFMCEI